MYILEVAAISKYYSLKRFQRKLAKYAPRHSLDLKEQNLDEFKDTSSTSIVGVVVVSIDYS